MIINQYKLISCVNTIEGSLCIQTQDILGLHRLVHFDVLSFALAVDSKDSEEVVGSRFQVRHHILAGLDLFVDGHPFFFLCVHLIQNIVCDFTAAIIDRLLPAKGDGGLCGVDHTQLGWLTRQIWRRQKGMNVVSSSQRRPYNEILQRNS